MAEIHALRRADGTAEFDCTGCGEHIVAFAPCDTRPVCAMCRFLENLDPAEALALSEHLAGKR